MKTRILPPDVYDALEFAALAFGGIGAGQYADHGHHPTIKSYDEHDMNGAITDDIYNAPRCAYGFAMALSNDEDATVENTFVVDGEVLDNLFIKGEVSQALKHIGVEAITNDRAVRRVNKRLGSPDIDARIPFDLWCKALNVVRGT